MTIEFLLRRSSRRGDERALDDRAGRASTRWPRAGSTTSWAAASTATRPTRAGSCRTSSRCSTTTRSSRACTSTRGRSPATGATRDTATASSTTSLRELPTADGGFAASQDADTEGEEGATFVWSAGEVRDALGEDGPTGAVRGRVRRHRRRQLGGHDDPVAGPRRRRARRSGSGSRPRTWPSGSRRACGAARAARPRPQPARDDKVLAAWNGLAIAALADAARALGRERRRRRTSAAADRYARPRRGAADAVLAGPARRPTAGSALVEGRPGVGGRRARGLREPRRRAARAVRGDVRGALVRGGRALAGRRPRAVRRPGRRLLRHGRRPRARSSSGRRTSRTTRRRRAARWRRPCCCGSPR